MDLVNTSKTRKKRVTFFIVLIKKHVFKIFFTNVYYIYDLNRYILHFADKKLSETEYSLSKPVPVAQLVEMNQIHRKKQHLMTFVEAFSKRAHTCFVSQQ